MKFTILNSIFFLALANAGEVDRLRYLHFGNLAEQEFIREADLQAAIADAKNSILFAEATLIYERRKLEKGYSTPLAYSRAQTDYLVAKLKRDLALIDLEESKIQSKVLEAQMKSASGQAIDLAATEALYQSLLPIRCKREKTLHAQTRAELDLAEQAYTVSPKELAKSLVDTLKARIEAKKPILAECTKLFGN